MEYGIEDWAVPALSRVLPLDNNSLKELVDYTLSLPPYEAAEHLKELIGDSEYALDLISSFNQRRRFDEAVIRQNNQDIPEVPKVKPKKKVNEKNNYKLPSVRLPGNYGGSSGGYQKKEQKDPLSSQGGSPNLEAFPQITSSQKKLRDKASEKALGPGKVVSAISKPPPSAGGTLTSEAKSSPGKQPEAGKGKVKVNISGGTPMHGKSTVLNDLDSAIRSLEIQTNPTLFAEQKNRSQRSCDCMATRHALLTAAPNCLNCGKVICVNEGLGPCTFCNCPLLSSIDLNSMLQVLKEERGRERMNAHNATHKRADIASSVRRPATASPLAPLSSAPSSDIEGADKLNAARLHRDKLLAFQAQNLQRTRVHDEAADFETPVAGLNMWATPQERALQLKRQQKVLREQEWNAKPEYEKRNVVVSVDLVGGKAVKRMARMERPNSPEEEKDYPENNQAGGSAQANAHGGGAFGRNPLIGSLIKPTVKSKGKSVACERSRHQTWRRVQDDNDGNEDVILKGNLYGGETVENVSRQEAVY